MQLHRNSLTAQDLAALEKCFIKPELVEQAKLFRVDSLQGAELVGRNGSGDYSGIAFPYFWPGETSPREYRLRRDYPDLEQQADGAIKAKRKYLSPPGRGNLLYFVAGTSASWLVDTSLPVVITEGEKKTIALASFDNPAKSRAGFEKSHPDWPLQPRATLQKSVRRRQSGNAAADNYDVLHSGVGSDESY